VTEDRLEAAEQTGDDERARTHGEDGLRRRLPGRAAEFSFRLPAAVSRVPRCDSAVAQLRPRAALLLIVQLSSERTLEPVRQDSCFAEKQ
jgi:hypothetical protein